MMCKDYSLAITPIYALINPFPNSLRTASLDSIVNSSRTFVCYVPHVRYTLFKPSMIRAALSLPIYPVRDTTSATSLFAYQKFDVYASRCSAWQSQI